MVGRTMKIQTVLKDQSVINFIEERRKQLTEEHNSKNKYQIDSVPMYEVLESIVNQYINHDNHFCFVKGE